MTFPNFSKPIALRTPSPPAIFRIRRMGWGELVNTPDARWKNRHVLQAMRISQLPISLQGMPLRRRTKASREVKWFEGSALTYLPVGRIIGGMGRILLLLWFVLSTLAGESLCCCALKDWLSDGVKSCAADFQEIPRSCCKKQSDTTSTQDEDPSTKTLPGPCSCSYCPLIALSKAAGEGPQTTLLEGWRWQWTDFLPPMPDSWNRIQTVSSTRQVQRSATDPSGGRILCLLYCTLRC